MSKTTLALGTLLLVLLMDTVVAASLVRERCAWTGSTFDPLADSVQMTPLVIDLDHDGVSDVVFVSRDEFGPPAGVLRAISGVDCHEIFATGAVGCRACVDDLSCRDLDGDGDGRIVLFGGLAAGDVDGDGEVEILGLLEAGPGTRFVERIIAFDAAGRFKWCSARVPPIAPGRPGYLWGQPALADLDADGRGEILVGTRVFSAHGAVLASNADPTLLGAPSVAADVDGDGRPEIVLGGAVLDASAVLRWHRSDLLDPIRSRYLAGSAVVDLEGDGTMEIVLGRTVSRSVLVLDAATGTTLVEAFLPGIGCAVWRPSIGTPAVGDLDGDGAPEIVVSSSDSICAWTWRAGALLPRWCMPIRDCSSGELAPVLADLDGDARLEVVLRDEQTLWIFAADGSVIQSLPSASGTLDESVAVADVDGDCSGEIVVSEGDGLSGTYHGIRIFEGDSAPLAPQRGIWNQPAYHDVNVLDDGGIPLREPTTSAWLAQRGPVTTTAPLTADRAILWPPNHRLVRIGLTAAGAAVRVTGVFQDESVDDRGDGRSRPDAVLDGDGVLLRAERSGLGDGRVYYVRAIVGDGACTREAEITVCVPHDRRGRGSPCVDGGALHDSTAR